jgi:hypothetical protein
MWRLRYAADEHYVDYVFVAKNNTWIPILILDGINCYSFPPLVTYLLHQYPIIFKNTYLSVGKLLMVDTYIETFNYRLA